MPQYMFQVAYTPEAWNALIKNPQDRTEAVRPVIEKLGGKVETGWFSFGEYDVLLIAEMPDEASAAAFAVAVAGGGACKAVKTTPLIAMSQAEAILKKAAASGYRPVSAVSVASA